MRTPALAAVGLLAFVGTQPTHADIADDGEQTANLDLIIGGCTAVIQSGQFNDDLAWAHNNRGVAYYYIGRYELAIEDYDRAIRLGPENAVALSNRANAYYHLGQYELVIEDCDEAIRLDPGLAPAYRNRGRAYMALGHVYRAHGDFDTAERLLQGDPAE